MEHFILCIDQGTTGSTALVLDRQLHVRGRATQEYRQIYPQPGWVEHNPSDILSSVAHVVRGALASAQISGDQISAIGITNQRETSLLWERATGKPLMNAIVWQDRRTDGRCRQIKEAGHEATFRQKTGLVLDPYFSGTKLAWMLDEIPGARAAADRGELAFGTIDTLLVHHLSGGQVHVTDVSNASRTLLLNIHTLSWDEELASILRVPLSVLPQVKSSAEVYGVTRGVGYLPDGIPIAGIAGDQQAALFGQLCLTPGMAKCTYGTGAFLMLNTGHEVKVSANGLLSTVGWSQGGQTTWCLEGSSFIAGAAVQWLRDGLKIINRAAEIEALARQVPDSGGLVFVPALAGLGAPWWRPEARGVIHGIHRGTTAAHLARATLEGIALQIVDLIQAMSSDMGGPLQEMRVDGGAAANDLLMQLQADLLQIPLVRPRMLETTALGAGLLAGLATGFFPDVHDLKRAWQIDRTFEPQMPTAQRDDMLGRWHTVVGKA